MATVFAEIEENTIRAFIRKERQERRCFLLARPKRRKDFTKELSHSKRLDDLAPGRSAAVSASTDATITKPAATHSNRMRIPRLGWDTPKTQVVPPIAAPDIAPANKRVDGRRGIPTKARVPRENKPLKRI
jgi:hypothetical protein